MLDGTHTWRRHHYQSAPEGSIEIGTFELDDLQYVNGNPFIARLLETHEGMRLQEAAKITTDICAEISLAKDIGGDTWGYYADQLATAL